MWNKSFSFWPDKSGQLKRSNTPDSPCIILLPQDKLFVCGDFNSHHMEFGLVVDILLSTTINNIQYKPKMDKFIPKSIKADVLNKDTQQFFNSDEFNNSRNQVTDINSNFFL